MGRIVNLHLFLCSVAPTAPAVQPAVALAVYGCRRLRSWARLHVRLSRFACMMRLLSPAIVRKTRGRDCGQRLSRKRSQTLIIGVAARFTRGSKRRPQTNHGWPTRKYRHARSSPLSSTEFDISLHWRTVVCPEFDICMHRGQ